MRVVNIYDAKTHLSKLINDALSGEEIVIAKHGEPLIMLTPFQQTEQKRKGGQLSGILDISDNFDDPLPKDILDAFYKDE